MSFFGFFLSKNILISNLQLVYIYIYIHIYIHTHTYIYVMYIYRYIYIYKYIYIYNYLYIYNTVHIIYCPWYGTVRWGVHITVALVAWLCQDKSLWIYYSCDFTLINTVAIWQENQIFFCWKKELFAAKGRPRISSGPWTLLFFPPFFFFLNSPLIMIEINPKSGFRLSKPINRIRSDRFKKRGSAQD